MADYIIATNNGTSRWNWPGALPWRDRYSRKGYPTEAKAWERVEQIERHHNAKFGRGIGLTVRCRVAPRVVAWHVGRRAFATLELARAEAEHRRTFGIRAEIQREYSDGEFDTLANPRVFRMARR